jgi:hypothetical protein
VLVFKALDSILSMATDGVYLVAMLWGMGLVHGVSIMCMSTTGRTCFSFLVGTDLELVSKRWCVHFSAPAITKVFSARC